MKNPRLIGTAIFLSLACSVLCGPLARAETTAPVALTVTAVGDMMIGGEVSGYPSDAGAIFSDVSSTLQLGDVVFGNLEGVLLDSGGQRKAPNGGRTFYFRMKEAYADVFRKAGFNMLSVANNHTDDFGADGRRSTVDNLKRVDRQYSDNGNVGLKFSGHDNLPFDSPFAILNRNNPADHWHRPTVALIAFGFGDSEGRISNPPPPNMNKITDIPKAKELVSALKAAVGREGIVIVSFHGGAEGPEHEHITRAMETDDGGEYRGDVYKFAHAVIDAGADLILGSSPHVPRAMEIYNKRLIAYSLGNFANYRGMNLTGDLGLAPVLEAKLAADGSFLGGKIHSFRQVVTRTSGPRADATNEAAAKIRSLTAADFPGNALQIDADGALSIRQ